MTSLIQTVPACWCIKRWTHPVHFLPACCTVARPQFYLCYHLWRKLNARKGKFTCTNIRAELALGWPVQSRGLDLPLLNTGLVVSLRWWGCQQLPVHPARSRVMDCVILCCWHCSRPEVEYTPPTSPPHTHTHPSLSLLPVPSSPFPSLQVVFHSFYTFPWCVSNILPKNPSSSDGAKSAHVVHFLALPGVHTCSVRDVITARAWEWFAAGLCAGVHFNKFARCHLQHEIISSHVSWDTFKLIKANSKPATRARAGKISHVMNWGRLAPFAIQAAFTNRFNKTWLQSNLLFS